MPTKRRHRALGRADAGVSDIVGNILLVGITVIMVAGFSGLVLGGLHPTEHFHADLTIALSTGDGVWGNGNEAVQVVHGGGESLPASATTVFIRLNGVLTQLSGASQLGGAFSDGLLTIGETWSHTAAIPLGAAVQVDLVEAGRGGSTNLVGTSSLTVQSCATDTLAPTVLSFIQTPADVSALTSGTVTVAATITDACSGVDPSVVPHLFYRLNPGVSPPAYTDVGAMTNIGANQWQGEIAGVVWSANVGKTLEYYIQPLTDLRANSGPSNVQSDAITLLFNYPTSYTSVLGIVSSFSAAQSASDGGAEADLREVSTSSPTSVTLNAGTATVLGSWTNGDRAVSSNDAYVTNADSSPGTVTFPLADQAGDPGSIIAVNLRAEVSISPLAIDDAFTLAACLSAVCTSASAEMGSATTDSIITYNITSIKPGGGAWTWTDVNALTAVLNGIKNGGRDGTWRIDWVFLDVTYRPGAFTQDTRFSFNSVPVTPTHAVELRFRVTGDTFNVQVWDGSIFTPRGATLSSGVASTWTYSPMTANEYNGGSPIIRFVDATPGGTTQGDLYIDYARVSSS